MENNVLRLEGINANQAIEYKHELIKDGLIMDVDFQWIWHSPGVNNMIGKTCVEFIFKNPVLTTFYKLRWE